jgi:imidazolonepropionase-like amidohydrolase
MRDGRIVAYAPQLERPSGMTVVDAAGRWLTPGLIDIHTHDGTFAVPQTSDHGPDDVTERSSSNVSDTWIEHAVRPVAPAFRPARSRAASRRCRFCRAPSRSSTAAPVVVKPVRAVTVQQMKFPGAPGGLKLSCGENPKNDNGQLPTSRMGIVANMRHEFAEAQAYAEKLEAEAREDHPRDGGRHPPGPHRRLEHEPELDSLAAVLRGELQVHVHCYRADDIAVLLNVAQSSVSGSQLCTMRRKPTSRGPAARCGHVRCGLARLVGFQARGGRRNSGERRVRRCGGWLRDHALGHSGAGRPAQHGSRQGRCGGSQGRSRHPAERAIRWITSNAARTLGLEDRIGTIAPGMNADVVIWSGDPFSVYTRADQVYIDGSRAYDRLDPARDTRSDFELGRPAAEVPP